jgi:quercetin dioxygenase-like cupin family protein
MDLDAVLPSSVRALPATREPRHVVHRLDAGVCEVLFVTAAEGFTQPLHDHDTDNVTVIVSGRMTLTTEHEERSVGPAEWYETRAGELHGVRFDADTLAVELRFRTGPRSG